MGEGERGREERRRGEGRKGGEGKGGGRGGKGRGAWRREGREKGKIRHIGDETTIYTTKLSTCTLPYSYSHPLNKHGTQHFTHSTAFSHK